MVSELGQRYTFQNYVLKKQFFKLLGSNFRVLTPDGNLAFFSHQKAFKLREDIRVYSGEDQQIEMLRIQARQIFDFQAAYDVVDTLTNQKIGALKRKGFQSIIQDKWIVMDPMDNEVGFLQEDTIVLALVRRFLTNLVPQNYDLVMQNTKVCDLKQKFNPFVYHLDIDFTPDTTNRLDRRLGIAAAILLAAVEGRQN